jgi:hypothetical protein
MGTGLPRGMPERPVSVWVGLRLRRLRFDTWLTD